MNPSMSTSPDPQVLTDQMLDIIAVALHLRPERSFDLKANGNGEPVGRVTTYRGDHRTRVVDARLVVSQTGINSAMLHAFTDPTSDLPHLTSDVAAAHSNWILHVDLMPRVDLPGDLSTLEDLYEPLTPAYERVYAMPGARPTPLPPRLRALSSAWLVGVAVDLDGEEVRSDAFRVLSDTYAAYVDAWLTCVNDGLPGAGTPESRVRPHGETARARDARQRFALFNPEIDPVWDLLDDLIGPVDSAAILEIVRGLT